jgi:uncharacterized protein (TIGR02646 family)
MKKLKRPSAPLCLNSYNYRHKVWEDLRNNSDHLTDIWASLNEMQGDFCAYCECKIRISNQHIEHFKRRKLFRDQTFQWDNLFGSCGYSERCGYYKDEKVSDYNPDDLIKPDIDNPSEYLIFLTSGEVVPRSGLGYRKLFKATETLRVLNLSGDSALVGRRRSLYESNKEIIRTLYELIAEASLEDLEDVKGLLNEQMNTFKEQGFNTALNDYFNENKAY